MGLGYRAFVTEATAAAGAALRFLARSTQAGGAPEGTAVHAPFSGKVWVVDGDTIVVNRIRVRLTGMDAPELSQYGGRKAKSHLIGLAGGRKVRVQPEGIDCYGRVLARVWLGEIDLGECMVRDGFAQSDRGGRYSETGAEARRAGAGLWSGDRAAGITDPALHRRRKRG